MTDDERADIQANAYFYEAFCRQDMKRMESLWSEKELVTVIHPGWPAVYGRENVLDTWRGILESPGSPDITCAQVSVSVYDKIAFVICTEKLFTEDLAATNIFIFENGHWRLVHHQAGPAPSPDSSSMAMN